MHRPLQKSSPLLALLGVVLMAGCMEPPEAPAVEQTKQPIYGGQAATACQWPTTVLLSGCTGTLVHPQIITTAAHCGTNHKQAIFGETDRKPARAVPIEYCKTYQDENGPTATDWAFCKLKTPVTDVPIAPILMGCETDILKPGQKVVVAGFGDSGVNTGFGTKRWVETTVNKLDTARNGIQVGGMGKAPCYGDSGGPAFVKLADGSWRVFGIDSSGLAESCDAGDLMAVIHKGVPWMEKESGIDITPCHDADGKWNPSAACTAFSLAPDMSGRAWASGCAEPTLSPPAVTCGAAFGNGAGDDGGVSTSDATVARDSRPGDGAATKDAKPVVAPDADDDSPDAMAVMDGRPSKKDAMGPSGGAGAGGAGGETDPGNGGRTGGGSRGSQGCSCTLGRSSGSSGAGAALVSATIVVVGLRRRRRRAG